MAEINARPTLGRPLRADEVDVQVVEVTKDWARVRLWPKVDAVRSILEDVCREMHTPFAVRHYACGRALYCGVGMPPREDAEPVYRDACEIGGYHLEGNTPEQDECDSRFLAAAALWDVARPVLRMRPIRLSADRVQINPVADPSGQRIRGYALAETLTCDALAYEDGELTMVQLVKRDGGKLLWQKA